jgi:L-fuculose-phosphate aldolase
MIGRPLEISHMDTMPLYRSVAYLGQWPGVPFGDDEGEIIGTALGDHKALLLAHHGLITTGSSVEEACLLAMVFEQAARMQVSALSTGQEIRSVPPDLALDARAHAEMPLYALAHFEYYARIVARSHGGVAP